MLDSNALELVQKFADIVGVHQDVPYYGKLHDRDLRAEEAKEWWDAWNNNDMVEMCDGLGDFDFINYMHYIITGNSTSFSNFDLIAAAKATIMGISPKTRLAILMEVCESNLSKFDYSVIDAEQSIIKYERMGIKAYMTLLPCGTYVIKSTEEQRLTSPKGVIKVVPKNKVLKSNKFKEPNFSKIL